jgi:hypothetical protein
MAERGDTWFHIGIIGMMMGFMAIIWVPAFWKFGETITSKPEESFVKGSFQSTNQELGSWSLTPERCLDGSARSMEGLVFLFGANQPVEEIRIDTTRDGDNVVAVHLADRAGTVFRVREKECSVITGSAERSHQRFNQRPRVRLKGELRFDCPDLGLKGEASFSGCLP